MNLSIATISATGTGFIPKNPQIGISTQNNDPKSTNQINNKAVVKDNSFNSVLNQTITSQTNNNKNTVTDSKLSTIKEDESDSTDGDNTVIKSIDPSYYNTLKTDKIIFEGMIPKLDNAFAALKSGISRVVIGKAEELDQLISGNSGTSIVQ